MCMHARLKLHGVALHTIRFIIYTLKWIMCIDLIYNNLMENFAHAARCSSHFLMIV